MRHIEKDDEDPSVWKFRRITAHEGLINQGHPSYKGSRYNLMIEWETGEIASEPLKIVAADGPVICAIYGKNKNFLEKEGRKKWNQLQKDTRLSRSEHPLRIIVM